MKKIVCIVALIFSTTAFAESREIARRTLTTTLNNAPYTSVLSIFADGSSKKIQNGIQAPSGTITDPENLINKIDSFTNFSLVTRKWNENNCGIITITYEIFKSAEATVSEVIRKQGACQENYILDWQNGPKSDDIVSLLDLINGL